MFEEIVTNEIVKPTLWALTSQKLTNLAHVSLRGRKDRHAAETVQRMFAAVAVRSREFGMFNVMAPLMNNVMTWKASPTDLSSVVLVVENPYCRDQI